MSTTQTPWRVIDGGEIFEDEKGKVYGIRGSAGEHIVETDCGFYGPKMDDAKLIERAVNSYMPMLEALKGILEIGKRDMSNPKYDGYFEAAKEAIAKAEEP